MEVSVSFSQTEFKERDLSGLTVIAVDVFRASTSIVAALYAGAMAVYPCLHVEEARREAGEREGSVLGGERHGKKIDGFQLGNSPREYSADEVGGREVVMTTTNGTRLITAARAATGIYVAGFVNATATAVAVAADQRDVVIATAGTQGRFSIEDALCAGLLVTLLGERARPRERDSATFARLAYASSARNLSGAVANGRGAGNVRAIGLEADLDMCLAVDSMPVVAIVYQRPLRVMRADGNR